MNRYTALTLGLLSGLSVASAQSIIVLDEDFEDGLQGWTVGGVVGPPPSPLWHLAEDGECGVTVSRMAAYGLPPPSCAFALGSVAGSELLSETFELEGHGPWTLSFEVIWSCDSPATTATPFVRNTATGETLELQVDAIDDVPGLLHAVSVDVDLDVWQGQQVRFGISVLSLAGEGSGSGLRVDDILLRSSAYDLEGDGVPGMLGLTPRLTGSGPLTASSEGELRVSDALPNAVTVLVAGHHTVMTPYFGGVLVPSPDGLLSTRTDVNGEISFPFSLPEELTLGATLWFQCWIEDPDAPQGLSVTNGLRATTS